MDVLQACLAKWCAHIDLPPNISTFPEMLVTQKRKKIPNHTNTWSCHTAVAAIYGKKKTIPKLSAFTVFTRPGPVVTVFQHEAFSLNCLHKPFIDHILCQQNKVNTQHYFRFFHFLQRYFLFLNFMVAKDSMLLHWLKHHHECLVSAVLIDLLCSPLEAKMCNLLEKEEPLPGLGG